MAHTYPVYLHVICTMTLSKVNCTHWIAFQTVKADSSHISILSFLHLTLNFTCQFYPANASFISAAKDTMWTSHTQEVSRTSTVQKCLLSHTAKPPAHWKRIVWGPQVSDLFILLERALHCDRCFKVKSTILYFLGFKGDLEHLVFSAPYCSQTVHRHDVPALCLHSVILPLLPKSLYDITINMSNGLHHQSCRTQITNKGSVSFKTIPMTSLHYFSISPDLLTSVSNAYNKLSMKWAPFSDKLHNITQ